MKSVHENIFGEYESRIINARISSKTPRDLFPDFMILKREDRWSGMIGRF